MKQILAVSVFCTLAFALSGCATMSEAECQAADWEIRGEDDGRAGRPSTTVDDHANACAEYGIVPKVAQYREGWKRGIAVYCTSDNGFRRGVEGDTYQHSCPIETEADFLPAYQAGKRIHDQQVVLANLESELYEVNRDLNDLDDDESEKRSELKKKRKRIKNDVSSAEAQLIIRRLEAQVQGYVLP